MPRPSKQDVLTGINKIVGENFGKQWGEPEAQVLPRPYSQNVPAPPKPTIEQTAHPPAQMDFISGWRNTEYRQQFTPDYQFRPDNPIKGPAGEDLPYQAQGWDWFGRPYYGDGLVGWAKGLWSRLTAPMDKDAEEPTIAGTLPGGEFDITKAPEILAAGYSNLTETIDNIKRGTAGSPLGYAVRGANEIGKTVIDIFTETAQKPEQMGGVIAAWSDRLLNSDNPTIAPEYSPDVLGKGSATDIGWQAGRILYSAALNPMIGQEFARRYLAGENPYLLEQELMNPTAELVGELIFDLSNFVGVPIRAAKAERTIASVSDEFLKVAPELDDVLKAADAAGNVRAAEKFTQAVAAKISSAQKTASGLSDLAKDYRLNALTATGKRFILERSVGEVIHHVMNNVPADDAVDMFKAMAQMASDNADEVAEGIATASRYVEPRILMSRAGEQTGIILRNILKNEDGVVDTAGFLKQFENAQGDANKMLEFINGKISRATEKLFPTVAERVKAGEKIPDWLRTLSKFDDVMGRKIYKPINSFFAGVYMGYSPGYAFRNGFTNFFHILVDEGPQTIFKRVPDMINELKVMTGGALPGGIGGFGKGTQGVETYTVFQKLPMSALSEKFEYGASVRVVYSAFKRTMQRMLKPGRALPDIAPLVAAGMDQDTARKLARAVVDNYGDVGKAAASIMDEIKAGSIDLFRSFDWVSAQDTEALHAFDVYERATDAMRGATSSEDAITRLRAVRDELLKEGAKVSDDLGGISREAEQAAYVAASHEDLPEKTVQLAANYYQANINANKANSDAGIAILRDAVQTARQGNNQDALNILQDLTLSFGEAQTGLTRASYAGRQFGDRWAEWKRALDAAVSRKDKINLAEKWKELGLASEKPADWGEFKRRFWLEFFYPKMDELHAVARDGLANVVEDIARSTGNASELMLTARRETEVAKQWATRVQQYQKFRFPIEDAIAAGDNRKAVILTAQQFGIDNVGDRVLRTVNKYSGKEYKSLDEIPQKVAEQAFAKRASVKAEEAVAAGEAAAQAPEAAKVAETAAENIPIPHVPGAVPSSARVIYEQQEGIKQMFQRLEDGISRNYGRTILQTGSARLDKAVADWMKAAERGIARARIVSAGVADAARDFTLLSYPEKKYYDLALAYVYPYQFWYNRTYQNWMRRLVSNPEVVAAYAKYRNHLARIHAGAPEWWKYNINTNELLGLDSENPLFFNLEATLNPVNGLTGVDFTDENKRVDWWTRTLDDLNKFGPSTWTPFSIATALALMLKGEEDAAARWGGRLIPQSATLKSLLSMLNINAPTMQGVNEIDPNVLFFSKGMDPYERRRVGRALGAMVEDGVVTQEQAIEAARAQEGDLWQEAAERALRARAPGQLSSFLFGVGFKGRSITDQQIDRFDVDWRRLWGMADNLSPEELRNSMDSLREKYPFMDTVLLSRKAGLDRDRSYAYNVLGRIPPGQKDDIFELLGLSPEYMDKFYNGKGNLDAWADTDRQRFMAGMVDIGAIFGLPDNATRDEWNEAKDNYAAMQAQMVQLFGEDIDTQIDGYYAAKAQGKKQGDAYLIAHPEVGNALDWRAASVVADPRMTQYYGSLDTVERYYKGLMYNALEVKLGADIWDKWDAYGEAKLQGTGSAYYKAHPELKEYSKLKAQYEKYIAEAVVRIAGELRAPTYPNIQPADNLSIGQQQLLEGITGETLPPEYSYTWQDWQQEMSPTLQNLVMDYALGDEELPYAAQDQLEYLAGQHNMDVDTLLILLENSLSQ